jgi:hypothetical protein
LVSKNTGFQKYCRALIYRVSVKNYAFQNLTFLATPKFDNISDIINGG